MQTKIQQQVFGQKLNTFCGALLRDWEKNTKGDYPVIKPATGKIVKGKIIQLSDDQLQQADVWEQAPEGYQRERVTVKSDDGSFFNVWAYTRRDS